MNEDIQLFALVYEEKWLFQIVFCTKPVEPKF